MNQFRIVFADQVVRSIPMARDAHDPTKWHRKESVSIGQYEEGVPVVDGVEQRCSPGPIRAINTIFVTPASDLQE